MKLTLHFYLTKKTMAPTTKEMLIAQCAHEFFFYGCYLSQRLSRNNNNILLTKILFKAFQDYFVKFKDFKALNLVQSNSRLSRARKDSVFTGRYTCWGTWCGRDVDHPGCGRVDPDPPGTRATSRGWSGWQYSSGSPSQSAASRVCREHRGTTTRQIQKE